MRQRDDGDVGRESKVLYIQSGGRDRGARS